MKTVLLVIESTVFGVQVMKEFQKDHTVYLCHDATGAAVLMAQMPDALMLQMEFPGLDGMRLLENLPWRPPVILSLAANYSPYAAQWLLDLGGGYFVRTPCTLRAVTDRLRDMLKERDVAYNNPQSIAASYLCILGIPAKDGGGK